MLCTFNSKWTIHCKININNQFFRNPFHHIGSRHCFKSKKKSENQINSSKKDLNLLVIHVLSLKQTNTHKQHSIHFSATNTEPLTIKLKPKSIEMLCKFNSIWEIYYTINIKNQFFRDPFHQIGTRLFYIQKKQKNKKKDQN